MSLKPPSPALSVPQKILSIQSHVTFGHVGNAAAVFPLQRLGFDVLPLHTCQLSNHTGYEPMDGAPMRGEIFTPDQIHAVIGALHGRGILGHLSGILSGWLGAAQLGQEVARAVSLARQPGIARAPVDKALSSPRYRQTPHALYLCDPVLGDEGDDGIERLYAAPDIPQVIQEVLLPLADIITPNRFELSLLSGQPVVDLAGAHQAACKLLGCDGAPGPSLVVVTSLPLPDHPGTIGCLAVSADQAWIIKTPKLSFSVPLNGTGDCIAALMLGALLRDSSIPAALEHAVSALYAVLETTLAMGTGIAGRPELALVAAQLQIERPTNTFKAMAYN